MNLKKLIITAGLVIMVGLPILGVGIVVGRIWQYTIVDQYELDSIARRLHIDADWEVVRNHVYCNILVIGHGRADIDEQLGVVGPFHEQRDSLSPWYTVTFDNYFARIALADLFLIYDESDILKEKWLLTDLRDTAAIDCP